MILHTVNKAPLSSDCLTSCLRIIAAGDALLLIEDGVYGADHHQQGRFDGLDPGIPLYVLQADVEARGLMERLSPRFQLVDDAGFVDLSIRYAKMQSWY